MRCAARRARWDQAFSAWLTATHRDNRALGVQR
jgi:hypothetical protein